MLYYFTKMPILILLTQLFYRLVIMQKIVLLNPKGGCGKSTLSTNLAGYYANLDEPVALVDIDPLHSSLNWLRKRTFDLKPIKLIKVKSEHLRIPAEIKHVIIDTPASIDHELMMSIIDDCDTIIIPVLPSPIDIQAASFFIYELLLKFQISSRKKNICLVANRAKLRSTAYKELSKSIATLKLPLITTVRESSNYLKCASKGASVFDYSTKTSTQNIEDWKPLINWLNSNEKEDH